MDVLLAKAWTGQEPVGWWMSEKLDGVRAIWDGEKLVSRNGNPFPAPPWWLEQLPPIPLDGELFLGRKKFDSTISIVKSASADKGWQWLEYHVFDSPGEGVFEERVERLTAAVAELVHECPTRSRRRAVVVEQKLCGGHIHLMAFADHIQSLGGEGVMLRAPGSVYERKRSSTLLKVKRFHDVEVSVLEVLPGRGKHAGRMGALRCLLGKVIVDVGTGFSDAQRENPPSPGASITIRYQELTKDGVPRFPVFVAERDYEGAEAR